MITAATSAEQYWHLHRSDCRNTLTYAHKTSRIVTNFDISVGSLNLPAPEAGDFEELLLLHKTADVRHAYHLSYINHTAAVLNARMCVSARFLFWIFEDHASQSLFSYRHVSQENVFCSLGGYILCLCFTERTGV